MTPTGLIHPVTVTSATLAAAGRLSGTPNHQEMN